MFFKIQLAEVGCCFIQIVNKAGNFTVILIEVSGNELRLFNVPASAPVWVFNNTCNEADAPIRLAVVLFKLANVPCRLFLQKDLKLFTFLIQSLKMTQRF